MSDLENIPSSKALAATVVVYRSLGFAKDEARKAMAELARRKADGDEFDYETFIKEELDKLPKPELNPQVMNIMSSLAYMGNNGRKSTK